MRVEGEYKKSGYFWLPDRDDEKIPGILTVQDGGQVELEIVGLFDNSITAFSRGNELERIIGHVEEDGLVTLDNCFYMKKNFALIGISKSKISVDRMFVGVGLGKGKKVEFNSFRFSADCLDKWVGISGIDTCVDFQNHKLSIQYKLPETINFSLDNGMTLNIAFKYIGPHFGDKAEAKIAEQVYLELRSGELREFSEFSMIAFKLTSLLCFAMNRTVSLKNVSAISSQIQRRDGSGNECPVSIAIYYQSNPYAVKSPSINRNDMLFDFISVKDNAEKIFNNWIAAYDHLSPVLGLYFSAKTDAHKYLDGRFLALVQGLETYHRRTSDVTRIRQKDYDSLVCIIMDLCPKHHSDWLAGQLKYGNEISLRQRLKTLTDPFKGHLGPHKDRSKLISKIVFTRNYLTHYTEDLQSLASAGRELWILCLKMEVIFSLLFLEVIGFTDDEISSVLKSCSSLKQKLSISL